MDGQALLKFLEVMSTFDWEMYCVSISGRILLSSFPNFIGAIASLESWIYYVTNP